MAPEPAEQWRIETSDRYNKIVTSLRSLATAALILPALFLREFIGIPQGKPLNLFLDCKAYTAWSCLGLSILLGLIYSWLSVKWVKLAWKQTIWLSEQSLERILDWSFVLMALLFLAGIIASVLFFVTANWRAPRKLSRNEVESVD